MTFKYLALTCALMFVLLATSQSLSANETKDINSTLVGIWKVKNSAYNTRFIFSTLDEQLNCEIIQDITTKDGTTEMTHMTHVEVTEKGEKTELRWDHQLFHWEGSIKNISSNYIVIEVNGQPIKLKKVNDA